MSALTPLVILERARALIEKPEAWLQGQSSDGAGGYCMLGALAASGEAVRFWCDSEAYLHLALAGRVVDGLSCWNDAPERTHADVLAAFDRAIESARAQEARKEGALS